MQIVINSALRGAGDTKITMITNLISNALHILFNYLLIGGNLGFPAMGVQGAALSVVLGSAVSLVISVVSLFRKDCFLNISYIVKEKVRSSWEAFRVLCKFGYSIFAEQLLMRVGMTAFAILVAKTGDDSMAAHQVAANVITITYAFGNGLQAAAVALIGRSLGEKRPDLARAYGKACQFYGLVIAATLITFLLFFWQWIMELFFPTEPHIVQIGMRIMWLVLPVVLFQIQQVIYMGCLRGAGDALFTAVAAFSSTTILRLVVAYIFGYAFHMGIVGIWIGMLADQMFLFLMSYFRFRSGKWTTIRA